MAIGIGLATLISSLISAGTGIGGSILNASAQRKANDAQNRTNRFQSNLDSINNQQSLLNNTQINDIMGERINQFRCGGKKAQKCGGKTKLKHRANGGEVRQVKSDFMDRISFYKTNR